jgi:hypothetical protein
MASTSASVRGPCLAARYLCAADTVTYIGIDSVRVVTAVPEPSVFLMLGPGLTAGLAPQAVQLM